MTTTNLGLKVVSTYITKLTLEMKDTDIYSGCLVALLDKEKKLKYETQIQCFVLNRVLPTPTKVIYFSVNTFHPLQRS